MKTLRAGLISLLVIAVVGAGFWFHSHNQSPRPKSPAPDRAATPPTATQPAELSSTQANPALQEANSAAPRQAQPTPRSELVFGLSGTVTLDDVPEGRFKTELTRLAPPARQKALSQLGRLRVPLNDTNSLAVDDQGALYYQCQPPTVEAIAEAAAAETTEPQASSVSIATPPALHSRSGATNVIYLDFNGHSITGTAWNNSSGTVGSSNYRAAVTTYVAKPFDLDGDTTTFSDTEQSFIYRVWQRVAEDYAGFNVDVTTEEPASMTTTTARALITASVDANGVNMPSPTAGGVAYLGVWGTSYFNTYSPALIYYNNLASVSSYVSEAASHEIGHNLSLSHDGTAAVEYYQGHGSDYTSWAPIMGASYYANVSQWSKGEYYNANNTQDDLALIAGYLGYATDDHGSTLASASVLTGTSLSATGIIGAPGDSDWFAISGTRTALHLVAMPLRAYYYTYSGNLDVKLELYDASGNLVASENTGSENTTYATLDAGLVSGTYYLKVSGTGCGSPLTNPPSGYTAYGSLGQYTLTGTFSEPLAPVISYSPTSTTAYEGQTVYFYTSISSGNPVPSYRWQRLPAGSTTWTDLSDDGVYSNTGTTQLIVASLTVAMSGDQFRCHVYNLAGSAYSSAATLTVNPAVAPQIYSMPETVAADYGSSLGISPTITGTSPMTYVWRKDGVILSDFTSSSLYRSSITSDAAGTYTLTVTNLGGTATSSTTTVIVNAPVAPAVYNMPATVVQSYGSSLSLSATITGTSPLTYAWTKDGATISGATSSTFYKSSTTTADSGQYQLTVTNAWGTATSTSATVTINAAQLPSIYGLPAYQSASYGSSLSLYPTVSGTTPITYQWSKDGTAISGATSYNYYKGSLTTADSGVYTLTATNSLGTVTSSTCTLTVYAAVPPSITGLSAAVNASYGSSFSLYPTVSGTTPITYQWSKDGTAISGATSYSYSKSSLTTADAGSYTLTATNSAGTTTSTTVVLTVSAPYAPIIYNFSGTRGVTYGQSLSLSPSISGTAPITYQWKLNDVALSGATSSYYYKSSATASDAGNYTLTATNFVGTTVSSPVTVVIDTPTAPAIFGLNDALTLAYGGSLGLSPTITGTSPITYQWMKDGVALAGKTSSSLGISNVTASHAGNYTLTATNEWGTATSQPVMVTVLPATTPTIANMPATLTVDYGQSLYINPTITGTSPLTYEWRHDGVLIASATSSSYSKSAATADDAGSYTLTVTNLAGTTTSSATLVTVNPGVAPSINNLGAGVVLNYGSSLYINAYVTGTTPLTYQWYKDGVAIPSATSNYYSKSSATTADSGNYVLVATNAFGSATSTTLPVTVNAGIAPQIYNLPATVVCSYGNYLSIYPNVTGTSPITYRWQKDGVDLASATGSSYSKSGVTAADEGIYTLIATNAFGTTTSSAVTVIVNDPNPPAIYNLPSSVTIDYGSALSLSATVIGTSPLTYQWAKDGTNISGATSSYYYYSFATTANSGLYTLTASNTAGTTTSAPVTVTVRAAVAPTITTQPQSVIVSPSLTASFRASATGSPTLTYQWYHSSAPLAGATSSSLTVSNIRSADYGDYYLVVTNSAGNTTSDHVTLTADSGLPIIAASTFEYSSYWIRSDHSLWAMGSNSYGQLGDGTTTTRLNALPVATNVAAVAAGLNHCLYLKSDGTLWAMGYNGYGQLGNGTVTNSLVAIQIATGVISIATGAHSSYFVKSDGTLWATGFNSYGQLGDGTGTNHSTPVQIATGVTSVSSGWYHTLFIKSDGSLWGMGNNGAGQLGDGTTTTRGNPVQIATNVISCSAGHEHTLFRKSDNTLWAMGSNAYGQLGNSSVASESSPVQIATDTIAVAAGNYHTLFVTADHQLWGAGYNYYGQLGDGSSTTRLAPVKIATDVAQVSCGLASLYITTSGSLWGMGDNSYGQFGNGKSVYTNATPTQIIWVNGAAPVITAQPASQSLQVGTDISFAVSATSDLALSYQWRYEGTDVPGATTALYHLGIAKTSMAGTYDVIVSNAVGSTLSDPAVLSVQRLPQTITFGSLPDRYFTTSPIALAATASSGLAVTYTVISGSAYISDGMLILTGTGQIVLQASQAGDSAFTAATDVVRAFTVIENFSSWSGSQFTTAELADTSISGAAADPDGDGLTNLVEYALGLDPKTADTASLPTLAQSDAAWVYTYTRPANRADLIYSVEVSTDLSNWSTTNVTHTRTAISSDSTTETWQASLPLSSATNVFFHLKITAN